MTITSYEASVNTSLLWQHTKKPRQNILKNTTNLCCYVLGSCWGSKEYDWTPCLLYSWILSLYSPYYLSFFICWQQMSLSIFLRLWTTYNIYSVLKQISAIRWVRDAVWIWNILLTLKVFGCETSNKLTIVYLLISAVQFVSGTSQGQMCVQSRYLH